MQLNAAAEIWKEIQNSPVPADRWLGSYFHRYRKKFGSRDRRFLSEITYTLFRHRAFLEAWARSLGDTSDQKMVLLASDVERLIRELPPEWESKSSEEKMALRYSVPLWLLKRWIKNFGQEETGKLLTSLLERPPLTIRTNSLKISRDELLSRFSKQGFKADKTPISEQGITFSERTNLFDSEEFRAGFFEVQDEGSQIVCQKINPEPGQIVWDVCAGGGGKSLFFAALMKNKGRIIATDIRSKKLEDLKKRAKRAGVFNIFPADLNRLEESRELKKGADIIVVDAPCSGSGTLRRNPDAKWKIQEKDFEEFHNTQVGILERALPYLKSGGKICYITCSVEPLENEKVIEEILKKYPFLEVQPFVRLYPHRDGTDGFFLAIAENKKGL